MVGCAPFQVMVSAHLITLWTGDGGVPFQCSSKIPWHAQPGYICCGARIYGCFHVWNGLVQGSSGEGAKDQNNNSLCSPYPLWFNLLYHNQILRKSGEVHALANYQRAETCRTRRTSDSIDLSEPPVGCSNLIPIPDNFTP